MKLYNCTLDFLFYFISMKLQRFIFHFLHLKKIYLCSVSLCVVCLFFLFGR